MPAPTFNLTQLRAEAAEDNRRCVWLALQARPIPKPKLSEEILKYVEGARGICEASDYEQHCIWKECAEDNRTYKQVMSGYMLPVGEFGGMPLCISLNSAIINGHKILFYHQCSMVTHSDMIRTWIKENMPRSLWSRGRLNHSDAMNFVNILHEITWGGEATSGGADAVRSA